MKLLDVINEERLDEINMSPANLATIVSSIDARAGMEFEMIVPGVRSVDDDDYEPEPDYDQDEPARTFDQIKNFFWDGDYNTRRDVERLEENLLQDYMDSDWLSERKQEEWNEASYDAIKDLVERDYEDEFRSQAEEETKAQAPEFGVNGDELDAAIETRFKKLFDAKVDEILADMGSEYDEAYEEWEENEWQDIWNDADLMEQWLESQGINYMSDVERNYDIQWPHWTQPENEGEADLEEIAGRFESAIGRKVNWSSSYHGGRRTSDAYVVEPDGSLDPDNFNESGLEFVSPPLPLDELLDDLTKIKSWAEQWDCYTNSSTGLHINVSVPSMNMDQLDYVKLALLLGDEYVLEQFGRLGNHYCQSALEIVKERIRQRPEDAAALLEKMKDGLSTLATKVIHSGATSKYTSINTKTGYIEFRSPGGDWLNADFDKIKNTLYRFTVALDAALDETKYKQEYAKKLYKLLAPSNDETDTLQYFARFSAGELPKSALTSFIRQAQMKRTAKKAEREPVPGSTIDLQRRRAAAAAAAAAVDQVDGEQSSDATHEIVDRRTRRPVFRFIANTDQDAWRKYEDWLRGRNLPDDTEDYGWREIGNTTSINVGN